MFHFLPIAIRYDGSAPTKGHGYQVHVGPMYSESKGTVKITSTTPARSPPSVSTISPPRRTGVNGSRPSRPPVGSSRSRRSSPSTTARSHRGHRSRPTRRSWTGSPATRRPHCTRRVRARMGTDEMAVVDPATMRVHGTEGLRVVDAVGATGRHERQSLRPHDDDRRKGSRHHPRRGSAAAGTRPRSTCRPRTDRRTESVPGDRQHLGEDRSGHTGPKRFDVAEVDLVGSQVAAGRAVVVGAQPVAVVESVDADVFDYGDWLCPRLRLLAQQRPASRQGPLQRHRTASARCDQIDPRPGAADRRVLIGEPSQYPAIGSTWARIDLVTPRRSGSMSLKWTLSARRSLLGEQS